MSDTGRRPTTLTRVRLALARLRQTNLRDPVLGLPALAFLLWLAACWFGTGSHFAAETADYLKNQKAGASQHLDDMAAGVKRLIALRRGVASTLARDTDIREALKRGAPQTSAENQAPEQRKLRWSSDSRLAAISRSLELASRDLSLSVLYVLDASGDCIAASNLEAPDSFIGGNYREREYFQIARRGQPGRQFAVGKVSKVPGLYFSAPVMEGSRVLGVVVGKIDLPTLSPWLSLADGLLMDDYGVVILARDKSLEMRTLPEAAALRMDPALRLTRYLRRDLSKLALVPDATQPELIRLPERNGPQLFLKKDIPELTLTVAVLWPLSQLAHEAQERQRSFWILALLGFLSTGATTATLLYLRNLARTRRVLRESELRFRTLFHGAGDAILLSPAVPGPDSKHFLEVNDTACALLGYSRAELLNLSPSDIEERATAGDAPPGPSGVASLERVFVARDGRRIPVEITARSMHFAGQNVVMSVARDISVTKAYATELELHRHHLEERVTQRTSELKSAEARYRSVVEIAPDGFVTVGEDQHILEVNDAYVRRSGYSREELLGMTISDVNCALTKAEIGNTLTALTQCGALRFETCHRAKDGSEWPVEVSVSYWKERRLVFAFLRDITERKAMEATQERARREAEDLARAKSEFLANMSHEIRTPLNGVLGLAQVGFRGNEGRKAQHTFGRILESGRLLLGVVNDILDFSKIEAGRMEVERVPVNLHGLLRQALALHGERASAKGIALTLEKAPHFPTACLGDPLRLAQVLGNLLSNAVKFTESGQVILRAALEPEDGRETLVFRVTDTGIGMDPNQIGRLFTPFEQADGSTTRRFGGTGLGLAISRSMAQLMGGEIRVHSQIGQGSRFELRLPFQAPAAGEMAAGKMATGKNAAHPKGTSLAGLTLLAAEDNDVNRLVLEEMLATEGARLDLVENGRLAVERVLAVGPDYYDLILMDVQMPEMDGMEATRRIRELAPRLPIIGQTAHALPEERERCLEAGMVDHVAKPLEQDELIAAILRHAKI